LGEEENLESTSEEELAVLRAENELLRDQLEAQQTNGPVWRRILAGALAVLAVFVVIAAVEAVWLKTTLQDEDRFVATLQSLPQDEAVATALSTRVATDVVEAAEVNAFVSEVLPDELSFLAAPLTNTIEDLIARLANEVITSDAVTSAWTATLRVTHKGVSAVLSGNDRALEAGEGKVVINLDEVGAVVLDRVAAVGLDLPDFDASLGEIVLYENEDLAAAQAVAKGINTIGWLLPVLAMLLIAATIWAAPNRHRMIRILSFGTALALLLSLAAHRFARFATLSEIADEIEREAAASVWDTLFVRLTQSTWALLLLALIIGLIAWTFQTLGARSGSVDESPGGLTVFLSEWKRTIQGVVVVLGLLFVLFGPPPSGLLVVITGVAVFTIVGLVEMLADPEEVISGG
jgi:hypothetical protein